MERETELLKGCTDTLVLRLLGERAMYGYELVEELERRSGGGLAVGQGTIYPLLHGLERRGLIEPEWRRAEEGGRRRKYYALTAAGAAALTEQVAGWRRFVAGVERVLADLDPQTGGPCAAGG